MKPLNLRLAMVTGLAAGAVACWAASPPGLDAYVAVETDSLAANPGNSWARAILFADTLVGPPSGFAKRLGDSTCRPMKLKTLGTAWVPNELNREFQRLKVGETYHFAGTVNHTSRRFFVVVDACYALQASKDGGERWIDALHPDAGTSTQEMATAESPVAETEARAEREAAEAAELKAREEAEAQEAAEKQAQIEAKRSAAEEARAAQEEARQAEVARKKAEKLQAREEARAKEEAERQARRDAAKAEDEARQKEAARIAEEQAQAEKAAAEAEREQAALEAQRAAEL